jgi:hypothetical protein
MSRLCQPPGGSGRRSGEHALERGSIRRAAVRREHELDRQLEQGPEALANPLEGSAYPIGRDL